MNKKKKIIIYLFSFLIINQQDFFLSEAAICFHFFLNLHWQSYSIQ